MSDKGRHPIDQLRDEVRDPRNRLEVHGLVFRMNGFPIYDPEDTSDEFEQIGEVTEPFWDWDKDLTAEDREYFWLMLGTIQRGLKLYGSDHWREYFTHPRIMAILIEEYGIRCWHYGLHRRPQFAKVPPFECLVCDSFIFTDRSQTDSKITVLDYHLKGQK